MSVDERASWTIDVAVANFIQMIDVAWSPGGNLLAVALEMLESPGDQGQDVLFVTDVNSGVSRELVQGSVATVDWLDAEHVVYRVPTPAGSDPEVTEFRVLDLSGGCSRLVLTEGAISWPRLAPDGRRIAFVGSDHAVYVLDVLASFGADFWQSGGPCG